MYVCMHACMYACICVCVYACNVMHVCMLAMHVCIVCVHACMHACNGRLAQPVAGVGVDFRSEARIRGSVRERGRYVTFV